MTVETEIAALTAATTELLSVVNVRKAVLDEKVDQAGSSAEAAAGAVQSVEEIAAGLAGVVDGAAAATVNANEAAGEARAAIATPNPRGGWLTATDYALRDTFVESGIAYITTIPHTSGTFATDLAAGKMAVFQGVVSTDLADTTTTTKGAGQVGFSRATTYPAGSTVGRELMRLRGADTQLVGAGDSIMAGMTSPNTFSYMTAAKNNNPELALATLTNDGVPGSRLKTNLTSGSPSSNDMVVRYAANIFPKRPAGSGSTRSILVIDIGANDYPVITNAEVAVWCAEISSYCSQARTDGFTVAINTIKPRTGSINSVAAAEARRLAMNDYIRRMREVDQYIDGALLLPDPTDTVLYIDGSHPTDAGNLLLGRALNSALNALGLRTPSVNMPPSTTRPVLAPAMVAILDAAAIEGIAGNAQNALLAATTAVGAGDYSIEWWSVHPNALTQMSVLENASSEGFGTLCDPTTGRLQAYVLPGTLAKWSDKWGFSDVWNHWALVRSGMTLTYYLNGVAITVSNVGGVANVSDTTTYGALTKFLVTPGRLARPRVLNRAYSAAEVLASYNSLSEFRSTEANYVFALDDGKNHRGSYVDDLSPSLAHAFFQDPAKTKIRRPNQRGVIRRTHTGSLAIINAVPVGGRIISWTVKITGSGSGNLEMGDVSGNGRYYNSAAAVGTFDLTLLSRFPAVSSTLYVNLTGYTISHTVVWEMI